MPMREAVTVVGAFEQGRAQYAAGDRRRPTVGAHNDRAKIGTSRGKIRSTVRNVPQRRRVCDASCEIGLFHWTVETVFKAW